MTTPTATAGSMNAEAPPAQIFTIFIRTTPELLWRALTESEFTLRYYYESTVESDWQPGSPVVYRIGADDAIHGEVVESSPPRRLVTTFRAVWDPEVAADPASRVTWEIEDAGPGLVKLTVIHDGFTSRTATYGQVPGGMPFILSGLKTLLETGEPMLAAGEAPPPRHGSSRLRAWCRCCINEPPTGESMRQKHHPAMLTSERRPERVGSCVTFTEFADWRLPGEPGANDAARRRSQARGRPLNRRPRLRRLSLRGQASFCVSRFDGRGGWAAGVAARADPACPGPRAARPPTRPARSAPRPASGAAVSATQAVRAWRRGPRQPPLTPVHVRGPAARSAPRSHPPSARPSMPPARSPTPMAPPEANGGRSGRRSRSPPPGRRRGGRGRPGTSRGRRVRCPRHRDPRRPRATPSGGTPTGASPGTPPIRSGSPRS